MLMGGEVSDCERNAKHNTNQLTLEEKKGREWNGSGFCRGVKGVSGADAPIVPPKLRLH